MIEFAIAQQIELQDVLTRVFARLEREEGQDLIEYSLLAALISIVTIGVMILIGGQIRALYSSIISALSAA